MLLIGSRALIQNGVDIGRKPIDYDYICTYDEYTQFVKDNNPSAAYPADGSHMVCKFKDGRIFEFEIAWEGSSAEDILAIEGDREYASLPMLRLLKESHKYKKNTPHFAKTMADLKLLRALADIPKEWKTLLKKREKESYDYSHPKLNQNKKNFFSDSVDYKYDHDTIHEAVKHLDRPAYTYYMEDGQEVMTNKSKFFSLPEQTRLYGVLEEALVLALERHQIPNDFNPKPLDSFKIALSKVCTSITSGWFRKYAYDNYDKVCGLYSDNYVNKFKEALDAGLIKPFEGKY
jgi:hypothetical protein